MKLNEKHHAFISACFYKELIKHCPQNGKEIFVLATQRYAEQRGSRMAQRAIRDLKELNFATYCAYGEWSYTEEYYKKSKHLEIISISPDYRYYVHKCPWHDQYVEMGLIEGACLYCKHLDLGIARGFNPYLIFEVKSTMHKEEKCEFILRDAYLEEKGYFVDKSKTQLPFEYHCGHIYKTFCDTIRSIEKEKGHAICTKVAEQFEERYGERMKKLVLSFERFDFNFLP